MTPLVCLHLAPSRTYSECSSCTPRLSATAAAAPLRATLQTTALAKSSSNPRPTGEERGWLGHRLQWRRRAEQRQSDPICSVTGSHDLHTCFCCMQPRFESSKHDTGTGSDATQHQPVLGCSLELKGLGSPFCGQPLESLGFICIWVIGVPNFLQNARRKLVPCPQREGRMFPRPQNGRRDLIPKRSPYSLALLMCV